jgi:hypothetical protein
MTGLSKNKVIINAWTGMFGIRMHEYAFAKTYAHRNNMDLELLSDWEGSVMFKNATEKIIEFPELVEYLKNGNRTLYERNQETLKYYPDAIIWDGNYQYQDPYKDNQCTIITNGTNAYQASIFDGMDLSYIKHIFELSDTIKESEIYKYWESRAGTYDVAHLRRGDCADVNYNLTNEQGYSVVSKESYYAAYEKFGYDKDKVEWISNDNTGKWHPDRPDTPVFPWTYPEGAYFDKDKMFDWLNDWLKFYFARTVFRGNSSFSFWACLLSPTAKVYSPVMDKQLIYGRDGITEEITVDFTEGNENHWMYGVPYLQIGIK